MATGGYNRKRNEQQEEERTEGRLVHGARHGRCSVHRLAGVAGHGGAKGLTKMKQGGAGGLSNIDAAAGFVGRDL